METEADIPAPIYESKRELSEPTNNSIITLLQEENTQFFRPSTVEVDNFSKTPSIGEVHSEVNYISPNACKSTEKPNQTVIYDAEILLLREDQPLEIAANEGTSSKRIQQNTEELNDSKMECDHKELEKESEKLPLTEVSTGGTNDNEPTVTDKVKDEDLSRAELYENEKNAITLLKEETEKPVEFTHVDPDISKAFNLSQDNEIMGSSEERSTNVNPHGITSDATEEKTIDPFETQKEVFESLTTIVSCSSEEGSTNAVLQGVTSGYTDEKTIYKVGIQKEVLENFSTIVSNEETEEKSMNEMDGSDTNKKTFSPQPLAKEASDNEPVVMTEGRTEEGELRKHEQGEIEKCTETKLLEKESKIEKPEDSLIVASEETKASNLDHGIEIGSFEELSAITHPREILDGKTDDKALVADETNEEILENVQIIASNEKTDENSLIQVDGRQKKNEDLEKDCEKPSLIKEVHMEKPVQSFPAVLDDNKASDLGQQLTEPTGFQEDQSLTENPQGTLSEKQEEETTDAADTEKRTQEQQNVAINVSNEDNDKNSSIQLDASQVKHETYLEKEIEKPPLMETSTEDINDESTIMHEAEIGKESIRDIDLLESEKNIDSTLLKKENIAEDHKPSASTEEIETPHEQSLISNPQSIMSDKTIDETDTKEVILEQVATKSPHEYTEENLAVHVDCSQPEHDKHFRKESEILSLAEASVEETNDNKSKLHEPKDRDEVLIKAELLENERNTVNTSLKEEAQVKKHTTVSLQAAPDDIKASDSTHHYTKMSFFEEEILTADPQEISNDKKEETAGNAADMKTPELQDIATNIPDGDNGNNSLIDEDGSEKQSLKEVSLEKDDGNVSAVTHEAKFEEERLIKADLLEKEKHEGTLVKEEVPIESLQVADEDVKALVKDTEKKSLEEPSLTTKSQGIMGDGDKTNDATNMEKESQEDKNAVTTTYEDSEEKQTPPADPQEISCEKTDDKTTDATYTQEELIEDITNATKIGDCEDNPPSLKEASTGNSNDAESPIMREAKHEDENLIKADLIDNEKYTEGILVNEKVSIDSLLVGADEIKAAASSQERETSFLEVQILTTDSQEIMSNHKEQTIDATELEEETCQDKNSTIPIPCEDAEKNSLIQADCSQIQRNEHLEKKSQNPSLTEAQTGDTIESAVLKEKTEMEKLKDSFQVATEDIKASASSQDTETCFIGEKIPNVDPQEISCDKTKETYVDVIDEETLEFQDIAIKVPSGGNEDNPLTKADGSQKPSLIEASTGNATEVQEIAINIPSGDNEDNSLTKVDGSQELSLTEAWTGNAAHHESKVMCEPRLVNESFLKADLVENEKKTDGTLIKEEKSTECLQVTTEDIKASASGQDGETSSQEEQSLIANPQENVDNDKEDKTIDATDLKEETSKEIASKSVAVEIPSTGDLDVNTDAVVDIAENPNCKQDEHMMISNEHGASVTSSASEPSEQDIDKTDTEKMTVLDDGSTKIATNEKLVETDPTESIKADAQVPDEENKAEVKQQDTETGTSQDVSKSYKLNGEEERRNSNSLKDISDNSNFVASEEISSSNGASEKDSTFNPSLEFRKETQLQAENEEAQKQVEDLHISVPVQDSSMENIEKHVKSCPMSATDFEITHEMEKLEEAPLPAPDENTIDNTDCKESEIVEDATKSFLNDKKLTKREQDETECKQEKALLVEEIKEPASIPVANDFLPKSFLETSEIDHSTAEKQLAINKEDLQTGKTPTGGHEETKLDTDKEEEAGQQKTPEFSSAALSIIEAGDKDGANRSIADVETKIDDEAPEKIHTAPIATESQEVDSIRVGETSSSISECEREDYEHAHIGTEEKPDSNEAGFAPQEGKSGYKARNQIKEEDEDVQNDHIGSCKEEAITESRLEGQAKQEEIFEVIKNPNEEKVSKVPEKAVEKTVEEPEEKLQANESKELEKSTEGVTKVSDTGEVNRSTVAFPEDEGKSTRADDVDNKMDEGFQNQNANTSVENAALGAQPKRPDENIMCEAPPTKTVHTTIEDTEGKKENANAIIMEHQAEDTKGKQESNPVPEFTQGLESEKQAQKYETCSSDEVQTKDEVNLMLSAEKGEAEKTDTRSKPIEDEEKKTQAEKVDFSSHTEDTIEVSQHDAANDVPEDNENSTTKNENLETKVSSEGQEEEATHKALVSETLKQEIEEQQLERISEPVTKAIKVNSQEEKIIDDDCNDLIENSSSAASENISESNVHKSSMKDTSTTQSDKNQESERQIDSLPITPVAKRSDIEIAEKDFPMGSDGTGVTELKAICIPSNDKHIVLEADHIKNINHENSIVNKNISVIEHGKSAECSQGEHELLKKIVLESEEATCEHEEKTSHETTKSTEKSESKDIGKSSLSDLFQVSMKETSQVTCHSANEKEPTSHSEDLQAGKSDEGEHEETKTDEEKDDEEESSEQKISELGSEAPVMVDMGDAYAKVAHKKSHNILSGVGSKVKHSIAKVKKAITGKSSHPKPPSPK